MAFATWDDSLVTGHAVVDNEHKKLINLINTLYNAMSMGKGNAVLSNILAELRTYTVEHFTREEFIMEAKKDMNIEKHKNEHKYFVSEVNKFTEYKNKKKVAITIEVLTFLKEWLINHIKNTDMAALRNG
jgi:hemerythrin-like metal-binding protein